jgi:hypothetical protein
MSGSASLAGRAQTRGTQHPAQGFAARRQAFDFDQLLAERVIVKTGVASAGQVQDAGAQAIREAARARPPAAGVCQSRCACLPITKIEALHTPWRMSSSSAALAHTRFPFTQDEMTATRCNSFWLKRNVSGFIG